MEKSWELQFNSGVIYEFKPVKINVFLVYGVIQIPPNRSWSHHMIDQVDKKN